MNTRSPYTKAEHTETNSRLWPIVTMWTSWDVERFINDIGYAKYAKCFSRNAINGHDLLTTNAFDLQRLGIRMPSR